MSIIRKIKDVVLSVKEYINYTIFKIKDYDRLEYDYCRVMCHATCETLSKPNYKVDFVCDMIDDKQEEKYKEYALHILEDALKNMKVETDDCFVHVSNLKKELHNILD